MYTFHTGILFTLKKYEIMRYPLPNVTNLLHYAGWRKLYNILNLPTFNYKCVFYTMYTSFFVFYNCVDKYAVIVVKMPRPFWIFFNIFQTCIYFHFFELQLLM